MKVKEIIQKNNEYKKEKEKLETLYQSLKESCSQVSLIELETLSYDKLKEIMPMFRYMVSDTLYKEIAAIYERKRLLAYPLLKGIKYYPILSDLKEMSEENKVLLDTYLANLRVGNYIHRGSSLYMKSGLPQFMDVSIFNQLCDLGILSRIYKYSAKCDCCDTDYTYLDEEEYNNLKRYFTTDKKGLSSSELEELDACYLYVAITCDNCDYYSELETLDDLESCEVEYKLKLSADRSCDSL